MNLMLDFETLGVRPDCAVLSLGAVLFDHQRIVSEQYFKFDVQSQLDDGRTVNAQTIQWWTEQSKEAREVLYETFNDINLETFVGFFGLWLQGFESVDPKTLKVWGNGASFDIPIADSLINGKREFWFHYNHRCFRTFATMTKCKKLVTREGVHHNALDDARYQAQCVLAYWNSQQTG